MYNISNDINILLKENEAKEKVIIKYDNVLNKIKKIVDDYYTYDYENEVLERLNVIDKINYIIKESDN